jgi:hypothetical protein
MDKKTLDCYDATPPEEMKGVWHVDLIYNGKIHGTVFAETEALAKKFSRHWVEDKKKV